MKTIGCFGPNTAAFRGTHIRVERAPDSDDIIWQNLGTPKAEARTARMKTYAYMLGLLVVCGAVTALLLWFQDQSCNTDDACRDEEGKRNRTFWLTPLLGIFSLPLLGISALPLLGDYVNFLIFGTWY